jgi:auxin efflux carrier family protein
MTGDGPPILSLLTTIFGVSVLILLGRITELIHLTQSITHVFLLCVLGWNLARRDVLDKQTQQVTWHLEKPTHAIPNTRIHWQRFNKMNVGLLTPCLLFSKVAFYLTPTMLLELWLVPVIFIIVSLVSVLVGKVVARLARLPQKER